VRLAVLLCPIVLLTGVAAAQESFDGKWRGRKAEDAPGSLRIEGPIQPDGTAELIAKGLTGHPDNAVGHHAPATPYTYRIKARFEGSKGVGTRLDARKCDFTFTKQ
jgi:hypothetical protein